MDIDWIKQGLEKEGKSRSGLAKALGRSPSMVTNLLKGERQLKANEINRIARYLEEAAPPTPRREADSAPVIGYLMITGEVAGGVWTEPGLEFDPIPTKVAVDPRWPEDQMFLLRVRGSSINRRALDGDLVMCLDAYAAPRRFQPGDWVIAERERGGLIETTVKKVGMSPEGDWVLVPDSTDPQFQEPILIGESDGESVRVRAFVLQFVKPATSF